jgi:putative hydrolase of the HAD superfamily
VARPLAVVWDYGNVLSLPQATDAIAEMAQLCRLKLSDFEQLYWLRRLEYDRGDFQGLHYWREIGQRAGVEFDEQTCRQLIDLDNRSWAHANEQTVAFAGQLHESGIKTAILSNMPWDFRQYLSVGCRWLPPFDHHTYSCEIHSVKPEAEIYEHCLQGLGVPPEQVVFVDDREPNIDGARRLGITAVHFSSTTQALSELQALFELASRA